MKDEESNWFVKWEEELPSPDELISLSQTLITPDLAMAFDIRNHLSGYHHHRSLQLHHQPPPLPLQAAQNSPSSQPNSPGEFESSEFCGTIGGGGGGRGGRGGGGAGTSSGGEEPEQELEPARTLKRPRLVWTPQLHKRFVDAVAHLGIKNAVPKTIMQLMSVDGLTRENVASHLQKYRLYLKRMQGISNGSSGGGNGGSDTDHLFASSPVPAHFLHPGRVNSDHFLPFVSVAAMQQQHQMAAVVVGNHRNHYQHQQPQHIRHFGTSPTNGQFENPFLSRQSQSMRTTTLRNSYDDDLESAKPTANGTKVLTLFPATDD